MKGAKRRSVSWSVCLENTAHAMNRDEISCRLSHAYDRFLDTASSRRAKNRKNWAPASSDEGLW